MLVIHPKVKKVCLRGLPDAAVLRLRFSSTTRSSSLGSSASIDECVEMVGELWRMEAARGRADDVL